MPANKIVGVGSGVVPSDGIFVWSIGAPLMAKRVKSSFSGKTKTPTVVEMVGRLSLSCATVFRGWVSVVRCPVQNQEYGAVVSWRNLTKQFLHSTRETFPSVSKAVAVGMTRLTRILDRSDGGPQPQKNVVQAVDFILVKGSRVQSQARVLPSARQDEP